MISCWILATPYGSERMARSGVSTHVWGSLFSARRLSTRASPNDTLTSR